MTQADDSPSRIWLSPACDDPSAEGRTWASPATDVVCECEEGGHPWVEYARTDSLTSLQSRVARYEAALRSIAGETDTIADFEGMAFRNFASDVLAGRDVKHWHESRHPPLAVGRVSE